MRAAKAKGVKFGRKGFHELFVETGKVAEYRKLRRNEVPVKTACSAIDLPRATYMKWKHIIEPEPEIDDEGGERRDKIIAALRALDLKPRK
jgi:hypothetical protein